MPIPEGWVQVFRGPRPKSEVWPRAKTSTPPPKSPQGGSNVHQGRWRSSSRTDSSKVRSLEVALAALFPEECGARVELRVVLQRAKEGM